MSNKGDVAINITMDVPLAKNIANVTLLISPQRTIYQMGLQHIANQPRSLRLKAK